MQFKKIDQRQHSENQKRKPPVNVSNNHVHYFVKNILRFFLKKRNRIIFLLCVIYLQSAYGV